MESLSEKRKYFSGKNNSSPDGYSMVLRSACQGYECFTNSSTSSVTGSPVSVRALKSTKDSGHSHHHHHVHHHHHHNQHSHLSKESLIHQHSHKQNERVQNWVNAEESQSHSFEVRAERLKKNFEDVHALSDHSSGYYDTDIDESLKTDYTYAKSISYSSRVTPTRACPSPNMSRSQLRRIKQSNSLGSSDEDGDTKGDLFKLKSTLAVDSRYMKTSTPILVDPNVLQDRKFTTTRTHLQENEDEFLSSSLRREWPSFNRQTSSEGLSGRMFSYIFWLWSSFYHSLYAFVCLMLRTDVWLLSRPECITDPSGVCLGCHTWLEGAAKNKIFCATFHRCQSVRNSKNWKALLLLVPLLLPLLIWQLTTSSSFHPHVSSLFNHNYLSAFYNSKKDVQAASVEDPVLPADIDSRTYPELFSQWEKLIEQKFKQETEKILQQQTQQMNYWQHNFIQNISEKIASLQETLSGLSGEQALAGKEKDTLKILALQSEELVKDMSELKLKLETRQSSSADTLQIIGSKLEEIEKRQQILEDHVLSIKNCCKKQELLAVGVSHADLDIQMSSLVQEIRTNLSQLALLHSVGNTHPLGETEETRSHESALRFNSSIQCPSLHEVQHMVQKAIFLYDADKTGLVDYALESAGGSIISTRCTETYSLGAAQFSLFGVPFWYSANTPRTVIQPQVHPGECWAMRGTQGYLVILLSASVRPTAFSLEHIPKELSPTGKIDSAPKEFSVRGLTSEEDTDGRVLGTFTYLEDGEPLQKFTVQDSSPGAFPVVELRIHSNHGNPEYTCLYRFRVHGIRQ